MANQILFGSLKGKVLQQKSIYCNLHTSTKEATNFANIYLHSKIHKSLLDILRRLLISNCGKPTKKSSKFLDDAKKIVLL